MSTHSLPKGKAVIEALARLGTALGYTVELERPVENDRLNPPAVDVAWLSESGQRYPLMIFEVESRETNAAASNPVKVFGQSSFEFEKPLFFFHVFVTTGTRSTRVDRLQSLFGSYNYRTYRLDRDGVIPLVLDILSQHRRIHKQLDLRTLLDEFDHQDWKAQLVEILGHTEKLSFATSYLNEYARRGITNSIFRHAFIRFLARTGLDNTSDVAGYETYLGVQWSHPLHVGLLALAEPDSSDWLAELQRWQEEWAYMSQIGPHFGLSREYDGFVLGHSPVLWALIAALMYKVAEAPSYVGSQIRLVLDALDDTPPEVSFFTAVWAMHVASASHNSELYELAKTLINRGGGINPDLMYQPASVADVFGQEDDWSDHLQDSPIQIPSMTEFRRDQAERYGNVTDLDSTLYATAFDALTRDMGAYEWADQVARSLYFSARYANTRAAV